MPRWLILGFLAGSCLSVTAGTALAANGAADLTLKAQISKTRAAVGEPLQLTLTLEGDQLEGAQLLPLQLPPEWSAIAQSQSQEVTWQRGQQHLRLAITYVVVARSPGTFQLGPFTVEKRGGDHLHTEPLTVQVDSAPAPAPPTLEHPPGGRITL